jgi:putative oxidoreductase
MKRFSFFYQTTSHTAGLILRITLAIVLLPHGCQMLLGWFGGYGFSGSMEYLTHNEELPWLVAFSVILLQFLGSLALIFGIWSRFIAIAFTGLFFGMIVTSHWSHGFFMNWSGMQNGEGFEYHLLAIGLSLTLLLKGSGLFSVDEWLTRKFEEQTSSIELQILNDEKIIPGHLPASHSCQ